MLCALLCVVAFFVHIWFFVFVPADGYFFDWEDYLKIEKQQKNVSTDVKNVTAEQREWLDEQQAWEKKIRIIICVSAVLWFVYYLILAAAAVKMQNLESYNWSMAAAIMGILAFTLTTIPGIWALVVLLNDDVKEGFAYVPDT